MRRRKNRWTMVLVLGVGLGVGAWILADHLQARMATVRHARAAQGMPLLEFQEHYREGAVLVVDVRDRASYERGHISGAVHVPIDLLEDPAAPEVEALRRRARGRLVVTYCSCPTEASSLRAARVLAGAGVSARALVGGYPRWVEAGGRVEPMPTR